MLLACIAPHHTHTFTYTLSMSTHTYKPYACAHHTSHATHRQSAQADPATSPCICPSRAPSSAFLAGQGSTFADSGSITQVTSAYLLKGRLSWYRLAYAKPPMLVLIAKGTVLLNFPVKTLLQPESGEVHV